MYKCLKCREIFTEKEMKYTIDLCPTDRGMQVLETELRCPHCDSDDYEEVYLCPICGEWESKDMDEPCENCTDEVIYWTAEALANVMTWLNIKSADKASDFMDEALWDLTHKDDDMKYLHKVLKEKKGAKR